MSDYFKKLKPSLERNSRVFIERFMVQQKYATRTIVKGLNWSTG